MNSKKFLLALVLYTVVIIQVVSVNAATKSYPAMPASTQALIRLNAAVENTSLPIIGNNTPKLKKLNELVLYYRQLYRNTGYDFDKTIVEISNQISKNPEFSGYLYYGYTLGFVDHVLKTADYRSDYLAKYFSPATLAALNKRISYLKKEEQIYKQEEQKKMKAQQIAKQKEIKDEQERQNRIVAHKKKFMDLLYGSYAKEASYVPRDADYGKTTLVILKIRPYTDKELSLQIISDIFELGNDSNDWTLPYKVETECKKNSDSCSTVLKVDYEEKKLKKTIDEYNYPGTENKIKSEKVEEFVNFEFSLSASLLSSIEGDKFVVVIDHIYSPNLTKLCTSYSKYFGDVDYFLEGNYRKLNDNSNGYSSLFDWVDDGMILKNKSR